MIAFGSRPLVFLLLGLASPSPAAEYSRGFTFCSAPPRPACIDAAAGEKEVAACEIEVQAFIAAVFKYRSCLEAESEAAVRGANAAIEAWKCRSGQVTCRN